MVKEIDWIVFERMPEVIKAIDKAVDRLKLYTDYNPLDIEDTMTVSALKSMQKKAHELYDRHKKNIDEEEIDETYLKDTPDGMRCTTEDTTYRKGTEWTESTESRD